MNYRSNYVHYWLHNYLKVSQAKLDKTKVDDKEKITYSDEVGKVFGQINQAHLKNLIDKKQKTKAEDDAVKKEVKKRLNYFFGLDTNTASSNDEAMLEHYTNLRKAISDKASKALMNYNSSTGKITSGGGDSIIDLDAKLKKNMDDVLKNFETGYGTKQIGSVRKKIKDINAALKSCREQLEAKGGQGASASELSAIDAKLLKLMNEAESQKKTLQQKMRKSDGLKIKNSDLAGYANTVAEISRLLSLEEGEVLTTIQGEILEYVLQYMDGNIDKIADSALNLTDDRMSTAGQGYGSRFDAEDIAFKFLGVNNEIGSNVKVKFGSSKSRKKVDAEITITLPSGKKKEGKSVTEPLSIKSYNLANTRHLGLVNDTNLFTLLAESLNNKELYFYHFLNMAGGHQDSKKITNISKCREAILEAEYGMFLTLAYKAMAGNEKNIEAKYFVVNDVGSKNKNDKYKIINIQKFFKNEIIGELEKVGDISERMKALTKIFTYKIDDEKNKLPSFEAMNEWRGRKYIGSTIKAQERLALLLGRMRQTHVDITLNANAVKGNVKDIIKKTKS